MSLKKNIIANYFGQGWNALIGIIFVPVYIKYLGIEAYGLIGVFAMLQTLLTLLDMGMTPTLSREMARFIGGAHTPQSIRDLLRTLEVITCIAVALIIIGIWLSSNIIVTHWLKIDKLPFEVVVRALNIMGVIIALRFFENIYRSSLVGLQRQVIFNGINCVLQTTRAVGAIGALAFVSSTIDVFFVWQGVISLVTVIFFRYFTYNSIPKSVRHSRFSIESVRSVWHYAAGMMMITLLSLLLTQVDKLLLSKLLTLTEYGYYTLAVTVAGAIYMILGPIGQAFQPKLCELYASGNMKELATTYHKGAQLVTVTVGSAAVILIFFAHPILNVWTRDLELSARSYRLLQLIALGNFLNALCWIPYFTQLAYGWTGLAVKVNIVAVCFIVPAILWVTPRYGAEGAAMVWVALNTGYVLISIHLAFRRILKPQEKWEWYKKDIVFPILPAVFIAILVKGFFPAGTRLISQLIFLIATGFIILASTALSANYIRKIIQNKFLEFT